MDIEGIAQNLEDAASRKRSAAFPFELPYRLVAMHSMKGDTVLDPFTGTGTTLGAAMALGRNSIGVELDESLVPVAREFLRTVPEIANDSNRSRLARHLEWVERYVATKGSLKYVNRGFPAMTSQETDLIFNDFANLEEEADAMTFTAEYSGEPQAEFIEGARSAA